MQLSRGDWLHSFGCRLGEPIHRGDFPFKSGPPFIGDPRLQSPPPGNGAPLVPRRKEWLFAPRRCAGSGRWSVEHLLAVCRVMESPFGVIDQAMFAPLVALGYEAALITTSQFLHHHQGVQFSPCFGLQAASHLSGGLGMIPRITIRPHWRTEAMLAAFLGQPIVIAGHHQDAANDLEALEEIAETVNGFGEVRWCSLTEIARANYTTRLDGATLSVSIGSRRILLPVPEGVREVSIHRPWIADNAVEPLIVKGSDQTVRAIQAASAESAPIAVMGPGTIEICSPVLQPREPERRSSAATTPLALCAPRVDRGSRPGITVSHAVRSRLRRPAPKTSPA